MGRELYLETSISYSVLGRGLSNQEGIVLLLPCGTNQVKLRLLQVLLVTQVLAAVNPYGCDPWMGILGYNSYDITSSKYSILYVLITA